MLFVMLKRLIRRAMRGDLRRKAEGGDSKYDGVGQQRQKHPASDG